jgi:hypothetical protein
MPKADQAFLKDGIHKHLASGDAAQRSRNKFRLRRPSEFAEYELRLGSLRVFYRVVVGRVEVVMIGRKEGNRLLVGGEEYDL